MGLNLEEITVDQIPGIGIIRARALKKAGWQTLGSLRGASVDDLLGVPGITNIKAEQILSYVQSLQDGKPTESETSANAGSGLANMPSPSFEESDQISAPPDTTISLDAPDPDSLSITFTSPYESLEVPARYTFQSPRDLMQDVALSAQLLLTSEFSGKWDRPFALQLGKLITLHEKWERFEPLGKKQTKQVLELLQKIYRLLTETPVKELTGRKSQARLSELIRDRRRRLRDILES